MYKLGLLPGKFLPPHRGHLMAIINAATKCDKLYVIVSDNKNTTYKVCKESNLPVMDIRLRAKWLSIELQGFENISVITLDETGIPEYPDGWEQWTNKVKQLFPNGFDVIFGGEVSYKEMHNKYFPNVIYEIFDYKRERYPICATEIRNNPLEHWDYILGSAREFFAKKVLITGTESCGKTTITKYLAKIYHTSWSEEEGRYYSQRFLGGNENVFTIKDFETIAFQQYQADMDALHKANKVVFYDTDATVTEYYANLYIGEQSKVIESFIDPTRYDKVLFFLPDVKWVADGLRWNSEKDTRYKLHKDLLSLYTNYGFANKIIEVGGNYTERLQRCISIVDKLIYGEK
jgi:HTH-type transcriptional regulator, transcriptional repressor of NAD biosynthesis genes